MSTKFKFTAHVSDERNQQRGVQKKVYSLLQYAEEGPASNHARCYFFSRRSIELMRAAGVCKKDICLAESKKALRIIVRDGWVITAMYANRQHKRVKRHEH
jgi:hypothetical protein